MGKKISEYDRETVYQNQSLRERRQKVTAHTVAMPCYFQFGLQSFAFVICAILNQTRWTNITVFPKQNFFKKRGLNKLQKAARCDFTHLNGRTSTSVIERLKTRVGKIECNQNPFQDFGCNQRQSKPSRNKYLHFLLMFF